MEGFLVRFVAIAVVTEGTAATKHTEFSLPGALRSQRRQLQSNTKPKRSDNKNDFAAPKTPNCPRGYVDKTNGNAYWWECAKDCPGTWWAEHDCGCACVTRSVYEALVASGEIEPTTKPAPSAPAADTTRRPPLVSLGPSDSAPRSPGGTSAQVIIQSTPAATQSHVMLTTTEVPTSVEEGSKGLSGLAVATISITAFVCFVAAVVVFTKIACQGLGRKTSRVEPTPEEAENGFEPQWPWPCPPSQHYLEQKIQPAEFTKDLSVLTRMQKEKVMSGGWTTPQYSNASTRSPSLTPSIVSKPSPPSVHTDASTRSPSVPPSQPLSLEGC